eukprot:TRINITY_DN1002_c1_g1_i1.p1 TRINITY_DN1002_c1_g1~~TRINITY_DN1002_c1_g1_i1.p1  ORF type:complete len:1978 (-),score=232.01 TRINITY_DN1002_c1_g1_i1:6055-11988(-)
MRCAAHQKQRSYLRLPRRDAQREHGTKVPGSRPALHTTLAMDQQFAKVVDHIALSGSHGAPLLQSHTVVLGRKPRLGELIFLYRQFIARPQRFCVKPSPTAPAEEAIIIAHDAIRLRALGFTSLEQPPLPRQALQILERVGMARSDGILQSELGQYVGLAANMVHHYLGGLIARSLVARKKVVLTKRRTKPSVKQQHEYVTPSLDQLKPHESNSNKSVTYTAVVVLTRYAPMISQSSASRPTISLNPSSAQDAPSAVTEDELNSIDSPSIIDLTTETRIHRVMQALKPEPHTRSEKDMKVIAMPESDRPPGVTEEHFRRRRHRCYRALRIKLERAGLVEVVHRECRARDGKSLGRQACMKLTELGLKKLNERKDAKLFAEDLLTNYRSVSRNVHPLLCDGTRARYVEEVGVVEQVYQLLRRSGAEGISIPEMNEYLDGGSELIGLPGKRIRRIVDAIAKIEPIVEKQRFEGSAMYLRISLKSQTSPGNVDDIKDVNSRGDSSTQKEKQAISNAKRRKIGITSLGQRRQEIVLKLLNERKVILLEPLGREIAMVEGSGLQRIDPKVLRRLLNDLLSQNVIKIITAMKPAIKESKRNHTVSIVALPEIEGTSEEVRTLVTSVVNRTLFGASEAAAGASENAKREAREHPTTRKRKLTQRPRNQKKSYGDKNSELKDNEDSLLEDEGSDGAASPAVHYENSGGKDLTPANGTAKSPVDPKKPPLVDHGEQISDSEIYPSTAIEDPDYDGASTLVNEQRRDSKTLQPSTTEDMEGGCTLKTISFQKEHTGGESESARDFVVADVVGRTITRINKLRAIDYGLLKGKMARARSFHKTMYLILQGDQSSEGEQPVAHHTVEAIQQADVLGRFTVSKIVSDMTVSEYAATIGFYQDHGDLISSLKDEKISNLRLRFEDEVQGQTSSRQILSLIQTLTRLGLVQSGGNSQWALAAGGLIRDFGKGMPSGVEPHGIKFSSVKAVDTYWRELEQYAQCRMSRKPIHGEFDCTEKETKPAVNEIDIGMRFVSDVYYPVRWATGVVRLQKRDQLIYESMLQLLSGVQLELNLPNNLITTSFMDCPLKRFSVEELENAFDKYRDKIPSLRATQRCMPSHEKLLLYSRYRVKNPIPPWIREREHNIRRQLSMPESLEKEFIGDHSCVLYLGSKENGVEGCHFRAGITTLGKRPSFSSMMKTRDGIQKSVKVRKLNPKECASAPEVQDKEKETKDNTAIDKSCTKSQSRGVHRDRTKDREEVDVQRMVRVCKSVIKSRAKAYYCNNSQALGWKAISSLINLCVRLQFEEPMKKDQAVILTVKALVNTMMKFCDILMVRAVLDSLALKVVIKGLKLGEISLTENGEISSKVAPSKCIENIIDSWKDLDRILFALIALQEDDVKYSGHVTLSKDSLNNLPSYENARQLIVSEFGLNGLIYGREELMPHMLEIMSFRFQRVADMHMRGNVSHGMLVRCISQARVEIHERALCCTKWLPRESTSSRISPNSSEYFERKSATDGHVQDAGENSRSTADLIDRVKEDNAFQRKCLAKSNGPSHMTEEVSVKGKQNSCGSGKYRRELVELVVQIVGREQKHRQDGEGSRMLLNNFCWSDIALARDRLLLRGALSYRDERDNGSGCFVAAKCGSGNDYMTMLRDEDEGSARWMEEFNRESEVCWEKSKMREAVCDNGETSVSSVATNLLTKKMFFMNDGLCMMARMTNSGASNEAIQLSVKRVDNDWTWTVKRKRRIGVRSELRTEVRRQLLCAIGETGTGGALLTELLERMKPRSDEDRAAMVWALHGLLEDRCVQRFIVEEGDVGDKQFANWHGVLYISRSHCDALLIPLDGVPTSCKPVAWWRNTLGHCDTELLTGVRDCILNTLTTTPGSDDAQLTTAVARQFSGVPRRAALEVAWALKAAGEARVECCVREGDALRGRWRMSSAGRELDMVDGLAVFAWRRRWRCAWNVTAEVRGSWEGSRRVAQLLGQESSALG